MRDPLNRGLNAVRFSVMVAWGITNYATYRIYVAGLSTMLTLIVVLFTEVLRRRVSVEGILWDDDDRARAMASDLRVCTILLDVFNALTIVIWLSMRSYFPQESVMQLVSLISVSSSFMAGATLAILDRYESTLFASKKKDPITSDTPP